MWWYKDKGVWFYELPYMFSGEYEKREDLIYKSSFWIQIFVNKCKLYYCYRLKIYLSGNEKFFDVKVNEFAFLFFLLKISKIIKLNQYENSSSKLFVCMILLCESIYRGHVAY